MQTVSSSLTFAPVSWWAHVITSPTLIIDTAEHFGKMSYRNRYRISGANGVIQLSVPLIKGREQRTPMRDVLIHNATDWQVQHWRTLTSAYRRSPFWEYYEWTLEPLFQTRYEYLLQFNNDALDWTCRQLDISPERTAAGSFIKDYPDDTDDLRKLALKNESVPPYYQVFADRIGFQQNLSILDLLFSEGPATAAWLRQQSEAIKKEAGK